MMTLDYVYSMSYSTCVYSSSITTCKLSTEDFESKGLPVLVPPKLCNYPPSHNNISCHIFYNYQCAQLDEIAGLGVEGREELEVSQSRWGGLSPQRKLQQHDSKSVETTKTLGSMMTRVLITLWPNSEHFRIHFPKIALSMAR